MTGIFQSWPGKRRVEFARLDCKTCRGMMKRRRETLDEGRGLASIERRRVILRREKERGNSLSPRYHIGYRTLLDTLCRLYIFIAGLEGQ